MRDMWKYLRNRADTGRVAYYYAEPSAVRVLIYHRLTFLRRDVVGYRPVAAADVLDFLPRVFLEA